MKLKEIITLLFLGLALGVLSLVALRSKPTPSSALSNEPIAQTPGARQSLVDPRWRNLNPSAFDQIEYIDEKSFEFEGSAGFRSREALPPGKIVAPDQQFQTRLSTRQGVLGLIVEARVSASEEELSRSTALIHRQGIITQKELPGPEFAQLHVYWNGREVTTWPLKTEYWRQYYARVDGDGKPGDLTLKLELPKGSPPFNATIKKVSLFSQDLEKGGENTRIGLLESSLRANALRQKIIVLGLDGLSWKIADPLLQQGKLPHLQKLMDQGVRAVLVDQPPLDSPKIWTTIATGRHPEAHGIQERVFFAEGSQDPVPVNSTLRRKKALWNQFSDLDRQVGIVNWFITWPAEKVNGFIVSDRARFESNYTVYPEMLGKQRSHYLASESDLRNDTRPFADMVKKMRLLRQTDEYPARLAVERIEFSALAERVEEVYFNDTFFRNFGFDLYERYQPDLFALYFHGTDAVSHAFYKFRFPDENFDVSLAQLRLIGDPIEAVYRFHDETLGQLMEKAAPGTLFAVLSDHGFQAQAVEIEKAYLWNLDSILEALGLLHYASGQQIDWSQTVCYTSRQLEWSPVAFLRLNVEGSEKAGIVPRENFDSEIQKIQKMIQGITFKKSGRPVFEVGPPPPGKQAERGDLKIRPRFQPGDFSDQILMDNREVPTPDIFSVVPISGTHNIEGVLVLSGPGIRKGTQIEKVNTVDIAPTLLALSGLPVGEDLDGRVIEEALEPEFLQQVPIRTIPSYESVGTFQYQDQPDKIDADFSEANAEIIKNWKGLGYLQ